MCAAVIASKTLHWMHQTNRHSRSTLTVNGAYRVCTTPGMATGHRVIGYVVISAPGKGISYWDRDKDFFYEVQQAALNGLNAQGVKTEFDAVLWHQGETDWQAWGTSDPTIFGDERNNPTYYRDKLNSLIADLRGQTWVKDNAYFICGETAIAPVNEVLMGLNNDDDPRTGCVSAEGLSTLSADPVPVHFDGPGLRELGKRYAEMYLNMTQ